MEQQILKRIKTFSPIQDSAVARILRASEEWKNFLTISILTDTSESGDPVPDRITRINMCLAGPKFDILESGLFVIDSPMTVSDWYSFPKFYEELASMYSPEKTSICTYGIFEAWRLAVEFDRYSLVLPTYNPFKEAICVEYAANSLLGLELGDDRSLRSSMEKLKIKPFERSYKQEFNDINTLLILQRLFRDVL